MTDAGTAFKSVSYIPPAGIGRLREQVARWRGVSVDNVLITDGAMNGIFLAAQAMIDPGDRVLVETPTFPFALRIFRRLGAQVDTLALRRGGADLDGLERQLRGGARYKAFYTIPDFQNLTGEVTDGAHKRRLLELADRYGFAVIADDPYCDLWFGDDEPAGFPQGYRQADDYSPLYEIGTFSKTLGPGWRVGWVIASADAVRRLAAIRLCVDGNGSAIGQYAISRLLEDPVWFDDLLDAERRLYRGRARTLTTALHDTFGGSVLFDEPQGGFFLWARLPRGIAVDDVRVQDALARQNVLVTRGDSFYPDRPDASYVRMGFSAIGDDRLREGVHRLGDALLPLLR
nr:PLP-dependent aminotransferase family protein [Bifidobacterium amazonense]